MIGSHDRQAALMPAVTGRVTTQDSLDAMRATYNDLDGWHARGQKMPPEQPERGSLLAADDAVFYWHNISETAHLSLLNSGEHLRLAMTAIEAHQVYPSAHFTVMRTALVCAHDNFLFRTGG